MLRPRLVLRGASGDDVAVALTHLLDFLARWNVYLMQKAAQRGLEFPSTYGGQLRYQRENYTGVHPEDWRDALEVARRGGGDCEDLAAYRAAELRMQGRRARPIYRLARHLGGGARLFHIVVDDGAGRLEDPSKRLGMTGSG